MTSVVDHNSASSTPLINDESIAICFETPDESSTLTSNTLTIDDSHAIERIYAYWFGENTNTWSKTYPLNIKLWFTVQERIDEEIKDKFEKYLIYAASSNRGLYQRWQTTHRGKLALIIVFDQFSRHIYRDTAKMFEFDPLALNLALEIINDPAHVKLYSLSERIFLYFPLVHSENLVYTTMGADLLSKLVPQVLERNLRKQYLINARAAKTHQTTMETFGRYPHRNELLGRQSTPTEEEYLKTMHQKFEQSARIHKRTASSSPIVEEINQTARSQQSSRTRLKILVLHGLNQNANSLKYNAKKLFKELKDVATFDFANAPLPYNLVEKENKQLLAVFSDENTLVTSYQRQWWNTCNDDKIYHNLDVSLYYIDQLFQSKGPFDGVLGFAEGATLCGILSGLQPFRNISFNFAILISGFPSQAECHKDLMLPNSIKNIASLHIYGIQDTTIQNDQTLQLAAAFESSLIVSHPGGHFTSSYWPNADIKQFLLDQKDNLSTKQNTSINVDVDRFPPLITFQEKIEATILLHQQRTLNLFAVQREWKKFPVMPVGLTSPINEQHIENIIENLDSYALEDVMLLVWCERTTFHNTEPVNDDDKSVVPSFFRHWMQLYLKKPDQVLSNYLPTIPKYGSWGDLKTIYTYAIQMENMFNIHITLLAKLKVACVEMIGNQLKLDHQIVLKQLERQSDPEKERITIESREWISICADEAPRMSNNSKKSTTVMAKEIAEYLQSLSTDNVNQQQLNVFKYNAHQNYRCLITTLCRILEKASPTFIDEQVKSRNRKGQALYCTRERREQMLTAPPSSHIINPEPQPVIPCSLEELDRLFEHLSSNKPVPSNDQESIVFPRGTIMSGGRLDLCKQVVGPKGVEPLLNAMKHSTNVHRLLLGNNIVGRPGAKAISDYIRLNPDSQIDTWYIACNKFDSDCISLLCDALATDSKVKALWLKRNPIQPAGAVHIARMLTTNNYLQTLDLLNTGLLDEGCEILFNALKINSSLKHIYLDANGLTSKSGHIIRLYFEQGCNELETLYLSCNALGDAGTYEIASGLKHDQHLKRLSLASNCVGADGAHALVDALIHHTALQHLNLGFMKSTNLLDCLNNVLRDDGAAEISRLIQFNRHIRSIDLTMNGITKRGIIQLRDALKGNRTLTTLKGLQLGQMYNKVIKNDIKTILEANQIEWGKEVLNSETHDTSLFTISDYLKKGQQLNHDINFPEHIMDVVSYYRVQ